jgi:hypothetical protein
MQSLFSGIRYPKPLFSSSFPTTSRTRPASNAGPTSFQSSLISAKSSPQTQDQFELCFSGSTVRTPTVTSTASVVFSGTSQKQKDLRELFPQGIRQLLFRQQGYPSCGILAIIFALSNNPHGAKLLENIITVQRDKNDGNKITAYQLIYPGQPEHPVTILPSELKNYGGVQSKGKGVQLLELGYAKLKQQLQPESYGNIPADEVLNVYNTYFEHHDNNAQAFKDFTGWPVELIVSNPEQSAAAPENSKVTVNKSFWDESPDVKNFSAEYTKYLKRERPDPPELKPEDIEKIKRQLLKMAKSPDRYIITGQTVGTREEARSLPFEEMLLDNHGLVFRWHVYANEKIDNHRQGQWLVNPHDTQLPLFLPWDGYDNVFRCFNSLTVIEVPKEVRQQSQSKDS